MNRAVVVWLGALALAAVAAPFPDPLRLAVVFVFLCTAPGLALVPLLGLGDRYAEAVVAVALSLALDTAIAETMVLTGTWSAPVCMVALAGVCLAGVALQTLSGGVAPRATRGLRRRGA